MKITPEKHNFKSPSQKCGNGLVCLYVCLMVFNATFNNISVISWRSVLLMEEHWGPGENHLSQVADKLDHIMLYTSPWSRFELTSVVMGTDCMGNPIPTTIRPRRPVGNGLLSYLQCMEFTDNIIYRLWLGVHWPSFFAWAELELTTLVVIGTDCTGSCKSNYHTTTTMTAPITNMES
jgi:hypothetical protein